MDQVLNATPLWLIAAVTFALLMGATEAGYQFHRRHLRSSAAAGDAKPESSFPIFGAALGLLALILGFSFSMALERYDQRRLVILAEANAIGTVDLRARLAPQPARDQFLDQLRRYVDARLAYFAAAGDPSQEAAARARTDDLQDELWKTVAQVSEVVPQAQATGLLIASLNDAFDLATARRTAFNSHIPASVIGMVMLYGLICAGILGYALADSGRRHMTASTLLLLLLTLVVTIIIDIDRPRSGTVIVDVRPLEDVRQSLSAPPQ